MCSFCLRHSFRVRHSPRTNISIEIVLQAFDYAKTPNEHSDKKLLPARELKKIGMGYNNLHANESSLLILSNDDRTSLSTVASNFVHLLLISPTESVS